MDDKMRININSVRSLYLELYFDDCKIATATGCLVNNLGKTYLITNRHVVTGRNNETNECLDKNCSLPNKIAVWIPSYDGTYYKWNKILISLYDESDNKVWIEHPKYKEKVDVVAIDLGNIKKDDNFFYCADMRYKPIVTEQVFILGYPYGFNINPKSGKYAIWTTGVVASDPDLDLNINGEQLPAFLVDAKTRHGQSGSPVIYYDEIGRIRTDRGFSIVGRPVTYELGIYSGRINKDSDLGYVWKWSIISEIINNQISS